MEFRSGVSGVLPEIQFDAGRPRRAAPTVRSEALVCLLAEIDLTLALSVRRQALKYKSHAAQHPLRLQVAA